RGSAVPGVVCTDLTLPQWPYRAAQIDKSKPLTDGQIRAALYVNRYSLPAPDPNTLYVVFVEDNAAGNAYVSSNVIGQLGQRLLSSGVSAVSAGQQGIITSLTGGRAYRYDDAPRTAPFLASGVTTATAGTNRSGNALITLLYSD